MIYKRGDIVWVRFPFSDASSNKLRPALIISNEAINFSGDYLLMQVTTRLRQDSLSQLIRIDDYNGDPMLKQSELRLHKVFILHSNLIVNQLTAVNDGFMKVVINRFMSLIS